MSDNKITGTLISANTSVSSSVEVYSPFASGSVEQALSQLSASEVNVDARIVDPDLIETNPINSNITTDIPISLYSIDNSLDVISSFKTVIDRFEDINVFITRLVTPTRFDNVYTIDSFSLATDKSVYNNVSLFDTLIFNTEKYLTESTSISDTIIKQFEKIIYDQITIADSINTETLDDDTYYDSATASDIILTSTQYVRSADDSIVSSDNILLVAVKNIFDSFSLSETRSFFITKNIFDSVKATESFGISVVGPGGIISGDTTSTDDTLTFNFSKSFNNDAVSSSDLISLRPNKFFNDLQSISDSRYFNVNKRLNEDILLIENLSFDVDKILPIDYILSDDSVSFRPNKIFTDDTVIDSFTYFNIGKGLNDAPIADDEFTRTVSFNRNFSDIITASDIIGLSPSKLPSDSTSATDTTYVDINKGLSDATISSSVNTFVIRKVLADSIIVSDNFNTNYYMPVTDSTTALDFVGVDDGLTFSYGKTAIDQALLTDTTSYNIIKRLSDVVTITDQLSFDWQGSNFIESSTPTDTIDLIFGKVLNDSVLSSDSTVLDSIKSLSDFASTTDEYNFDVVKSLSDNTSIADNLIFDTEKVLSDSATINDITIYNVTKSFDDAVISQDAFTRTVVWNRDFSETQNVIDTLSLAFSMGNINNSVTSTDGANLTVGLNKSDSVSGSDFGSMSYQGYTEDMTYFAEDYVGGTRTF